MNKLALFLLSCVAFAANPPVISNITVQSSTHSQFNIGWNTDSPSTTVINFGTTSAYGCTVTAPLDTAVTTHGYFVSGYLTCQLTPGETVHYQVCSTDSMQTCSSDQTITLAMLPSPHPALPIAPTAVSGVSSEPTITGATYTVVGAGTASDLQAKITSAAADTTGNRQVCGAAGNTVYGRFDLKVQASMTKWVVLTTCSGTFPPFGVNADMTYAPNNFQIVSNVQYAWFAVETPGADCTGNEDNFYWDSGSSSFALVICENVDHKYHTISATTGSGAPMGAATDGAFYFNSAFSNHETNSTWVGHGTTWIPIQWVNWNAFVDSAALYTDANAAYWWIKGVTIKWMGIPAAWTATYCTGHGGAAGRPVGCFSGSDVYTLSSNDHIVLDRNVIDGLGYPSQQWYAVQADGSNWAIMNNYFNEVNRWYASSAFGGDQDAVCINMTYGPGPILIQGNYFQNCVGITIFHPDDAGNVTTPYETDNGTVINNVISISDAYNFQSKFSNGRFYWRRHSFELKRGKRWLVQGNSFIGGYVTVNQGPCCAIGPRPGPGSNLTNTVGVTDVDFISNYIWNSPGGFFVFGHQDGSPANGNNPPLYGVTRVRMQNNLAVAVNLTVGVDAPSCTTCTKAADNGATPGGNFLQSSEPSPAEDVTVRHNTSLGMKGQYSQAVGFDGGTNWQGEGWNFQDNLAPWITTDGPTLAGTWFDGSLNGTAALNKALAQYVFGFNALQNANGAQSGYPSNTFWQTSATGFGLTALPTTSYTAIPETSFALTAGSPYHNAGSDGTDIGVAIPALQTAQGLVLSFIVTPTSSTAATASATTTTTTGCPVDVSTSSVFSSFTRFAQAGGSTSQSTSLTGLTTGTNYGRLNCPGAGNQPIFTFVLSGGTKPPQHNGKNKKNGKHLIF